MEMRSQAEDPADKPCSSHPGLRHAGEQSSTWGLQGEGLGVPGDRQRVPSSAGLSGHDSSPSLPPHQDQAGLWEAGRAVHM